ncbi:hypothetical protein ATANTOWER_013179 [Ataeniobius toweri]|uniref:Uncharacterized protein n=1 Tax=Ataeniobius toweri TaxID=208326 RepID=A0ABU7C845_9TELE|nr:hypothetical protein [Ataeniobius toweri]
MLKRSWWENSFSQGNPARHNTCLFLVCAVSSVHRRIITEHPHTLTHTAPGVTATGSDASHALDRVSISV